MIIAQIISFLLVVELVALSSLPLVVKIFPWSIGYAFGISRIFGQFLLTVTLWILVSLGFLSSSAFSTLLVMAATLLIGIFVNKNFIIYLRTESNYLGFYFVFLFFLLMRFLHPEIHWGEKPMDFTFLNYFTNLNSLPPIEPWAAGLQMRYYYGGYFLYSTLLKLAHISPDVGYNLIVSVIPALYFSGLCAIFRSFAVSSRSAVLFALLIIFASNPEMFIGIITGRKIDSHLFWASTRVYTTPAFTEYPFWTFLFADLHPHMMAMPFVALFLLLSFEAIKIGFKFYQKFLLSLILSFLVLVNAWDAIACSLLLMFFWLGFNYFRGFSWRFFSDSLTFAALIFFLCLPVFLSIKTSSAGSMMWATEQEFNSLDKILRIFGFWFCSLLLTLPLLFDYKIDKVKLSFVVIVSSLLVALVSCSIYFVQSNPPWPIVSATLSALVFLVFARNTNSKINPQLLILVCYSFTLFLLVELVVVIDRMNSIFKLHFFLWTCVSVFTLSFFYQCCKHLNSKLVIYLNLPLVLMSLIASSYSLTIGIKGFHWNIAEIRKELNGFNYRMDYNISDYRLITWLRKNAKSEDIIAEAHGPSYQDFSRISINTGLATVLGWDYHVSQRGVSQYEIQRRKEFLTSLYTSPNIEDVCSELKEFNIKYVIVGELERKHYNIAQDRFPNGLRCLKLSYSSAQSYVLSTI